MDKITKLEDNIKDSLIDIFGNLEGSKLISQKIAIYIICAIVSFLFILILKIYYFIKI